MERRLAAILTADVVGYSKMMGADEAATLAAFSELRHKDFEPLVVGHQGDVVKRLGDGWLVEFSSALDAVNCAIAVQERLLKHKTIKLRIGVHIGDVMHDDEGDIHGDGVNISARLEGISNPGGVAISDQVYNSLDATKSSLFWDGGEHELKNITRSIRVWNWPCATTKGETAVEPGENLIPSILLEAFSIGGDTDAAADLALELHSGLLDALSNRSGVRVVSAVDGGNSPTYLLKGRCRVSGNRCRLHISIAVAANGETIWTTKIDGKIEDMFDFVDDVVWKVGATIRVHVNAYAGAIYASQPDDGLTVQQLLTKAAFFFLQLDGKNAVLSRKTMAAAVAKAPDNPMALGMLAYAMMQTIPLALERIEDVDVDAIMTLADRAVYHGPNVDYAFHNRAQIRLWLCRDHHGCTKDAMSALAINPGYHLANDDLALVNIFGGNANRGVEILENTMKQVPDQSATPYRLSILGIGYAILGDMSSALTKTLDAYERKPMVRLHALAYAAAASKDEAITRSTVFRRMVEHHVLRVSDADRFPFAQEEKTALFAAMLRRSCLPE